MQLRVLTEADLRQSLDMPEAIEAMRDAFGGLSSGRATVPVRTVLEADGVTLLAMPGALGGAPSQGPARPGETAAAEREGGEEVHGNRAGVPASGPGAGALGAKLVTVAPANRSRGLPAIHALIVLLDPATGAPVAVMDGEWLTALRTGAGSGLATDLLALPDADTLAVIGAGVQARTQIQAVRAVRPIRSVRIHSRTRSSAERLAGELEGVRAIAVDDARTAVAGAQVVVAATDSTAPVVPEVLGPGTHVNAVGGYRPDMQEIPSVLMARARIVVDQLEAARAEAGDLVIPLSQGLVTEAGLTELGALVNGDASGRASREEITVFKSVGNAAQDLAVARAALRVAEGRGLGVLVG